MTFLPSVKIQFMSEKCWFGGVNEVSLILMLHTGSYLLIYVYTGLFRQKLRPVSFISPLVFLHYFSRVLHFKILLFTIYNLHFTVYIFIRYWLFNYSVIVLFFFSFSRLLLFSFFLLNNSLSSFFISKNSQPRRSDFWRRR